MADASEGTMKQHLSIPHPAEAGPDRAEQTVNIHCLAGSSFELDVNFAERGWEVAEPIAARQNWPRCMATCSDIRWCSHGILEKSAKPRHRTSQQPAEFDAWPRCQPELKLEGHPTTQQPAEIEIWRRLQPGSGGHSNYPLACTV